MAAATEDTEREDESDPVDGLDLRAHDDVARLLRPREFTAKIHPAPANGGHGRK